MVYTASRLFVLVLVICIVIGLVFILVGIIVSVFVQIVIVLFILLFLFIFVITKQSALFNIWTETRNILGWERDLPGLAWRFVDLAQDHLYLVIADRRDGGCIFVPALDQANQTLAQPGI